MGCTMIRTISSQVPAPRRSRPVVRVPGRQRGVTLAELSVVTALAAVLAAIGLPAMTDLVDAQRRISAVNRFVSSLQFARSEAIKRNARAVLCKSADGLQCTQAGDWEQGWIVFHDANNNASVDAGETVLQRHGALGGRLRLSGNQPVARYVSYSAAGTARLLSGAFQAGSFVLCPGAGSRDRAVRRIVLSPTGRPRTVEGAASDCP